MAERNNFMSCLYQYHFILKYLLHTITIAPFGKDMCLKALALKNGIILFICGIKRIRMLTRLSLNF